MGKFKEKRFESAKQEWETPASLFDPLNEEFKFTLDVCADSSNAKVKRFIDKETDALSVDWENEVCWMNPPYAETAKWIKYAYEQSAHCTVVALVPSRTNTSWWHDYCMNGELRFIRGRPRFGDAPHGLPQPLTIVVFRRRDGVGNHGTGPADAR